MLIIILVIVHVVGICIYCKRFYLGQGILSLPWDDSSDPFYSESGSDDTNDSDQLTQTKLSTPVHPGVPTIASLYNPLQLPPTCPTPLNTLWYWVLPNAPQTTSRPGRTTHAVTSEINGNTHTPNPNPPNHFQTTLLVQTNNHHWGDPMIMPKLSNTFRVLSRNINTLSTQQIYLQ